MMKTWKNSFTSMQKRLLEGLEMGLLKRRAAIIRCATGLALAGLCLPAIAPAAEVPCEDLARVSLPETTIDFARSTPAGEFPTPPRGSDPQTKGYANLPSFCRVAATVKPTTDSDIHVEVWMPESGWNNKFEAVGNGGWAGSIRYADMAVALASGYATASTDTGHEGNSGAFGLGHPEKLTDYSYRAVHEMVVVAKAMIGLFYGTTPRISFFSGCSLGGHQGLTEAEKYPSDFDAIVAGAPSLSWSHLNAARMYMNAFVHRSEDSYIPPAKYSVIHEAVLQACDALDGVKDGVLEDPRRCHFDPKVLECHGTEGPACLTTAQIESARAMYGPVKSPKTGDEIYPPMMQPGSELDWGVVAGPEPLLYVREAFQYLVYKDPHWDWHQFNPATDLDKVLATDTGLTDFDYPTLKAYFDRGGKLLIYHGWSDGTISPMGTVDYFKSIETRLGQAVVGKSIELYMIPGMTHCTGGPGTDVFDKMAAIERWVATGTAPARIVASHRDGTKVDRTRPLCPFGQVAAYKGSGSTDEAAHFVCAAERQE
jgi:feruloyl esterase